jgi:hypothetical protein
MGVIDGDAGVCWPAAAATANEAGTFGCTPHTAFSNPVCSMPTDSTMLADGAFVLRDGAPALPECNDPCGTSEYVLSCAGTSPDTALQCTVVPVVSGSDAGASLYCCPCAGVTP